MSATQTDTATTTREVAERYFGAVTDRDVDAMCACWKEGGIENIIGMTYAIAPDGVREFFEPMFAAFPDADFEVLEMTDRTTAAPCSGGCAPRSPARRSRASSRPARASRCSAATSCRSTTA